jgi:hypothetical protein
MRAKGEFLAAKHRHQQQQALYEAIKRCRRDGTAFARFRGERMQLFRDLDDPRALALGYGQWALVKAEGRVRLAWLDWKNGCRASLIGPGDLWVQGGAKSFQIDSKKILCAAISARIP